MSEFVKKLDQVSRGAGRALGFGAAGKARTPPMMLITSLSHADTEMVMLAVSGKADAVLFDIKDLAGQVDSLSLVGALLEKLPWGVRLPEADIEGMNRLTEAGCDFVMLGPEAAAGVLHEEKMGKVLEVDMSLKDGLVRAIGQLSVEALLLVEDNQSGPLTINQLLNYHRLSEFVDKPLLAVLPRELTDLEALLDAGIKGVVMELSGKDLEVRLKEVQGSIQNLTASKKKSKGENHPVLPSVSSFDSGNDGY